MALKTDIRPRSTSQKSQSKIHRADGQMNGLMGFIVHSINKLRGKSSDDSLDGLRERQHITIRNPWRAVEIVSDSHSCTASKQIKYGRFLCAEAPKLPLPGCTSIHCTCRYSHFPDRRRGARRAVELGVSVHLLSAPPSERRVGRGRRSTDG